MRSFSIILLGLFGCTLYCIGQVENLAAVGGPLPVEPDGASLAPPPDGNQLLLEAEPLRDPFWPVGFQPEEEVELEEVVEEDAPLGQVDWSRLSAEERAVIKSKMSVGGILQQNDSCIAIINNKVMQEGSQLELSANGRTYQFVVQTLTHSKIVLESSSQ
jgi:hypothetical protein